MRDEKGYDMLYHVTSYHIITHLLPFFLNTSVTLERRPWTPENGILTPTMKLKRVALKTRYSEEISSMYRQLRQEASPLSRL